jgi:putative tryptophan/tyrosine transport system substrate-binding protein
MKKKAIILAIVIVAAVALVGVLAWQRYMIKQPVVQTKIFRVGLLQFAPVVSQNMDGFKLGMKELGYQEGQNIVYTYRDANGSLDDLKKYAKELVTAQQDLIFVNTSPATKVVKEMTANTTIPVVFSMVSDPIGAGFVKAVESSGNNLTGTSCAYAEIASKRLSVLKEVAPNVKNVMVFYRPEDLSGNACTTNIYAKAPELGMKIIGVPIAKKEDIEAKLKTLKPGEVDALMDPGDSMVSSAMDVIVSYSYSLKIPYMALSKGEVEKGATIGYAVDYEDLGKQSSLIANQVLSGINPSDIPFEMPRRWFFSINKASAEKIGLTIPAEVLEKADLVVKQ